MAQFVNLVGEVVRYQPVPGKPFAFKVTVDDVPVTLGFFTARMKEEKTK